MGVFTLTVQQLLDSDFDFGLTADDYPLWDERYRGVRDAANRWQYTRSVDGTAFYGLNRKILDHYLYYEIGQETPDMFRHILNRTMREIMPYYNLMYQTEAAISDPFETMRMTHETDTEATVSGETSEHSVTDANGSTNSKARAVNSTMPQTMLHENSDYASSASDTFSASGSEQDSTVDVSGTTGSSSTGTTRLEITGSTGARGQLIRDYRSSLINVDLMILKELEPLFMMVMDTADNNSRDGSIGYGPYYNGLWPYF